MISLFIPVALFIPIDDTHTVLVNINQSVVEASPSDKSNNRGMVNIRLCAYTDFLNHLVYLDISASIPKATLRT